MKKKIRKIFEFEKNRKFSLKLYENEKIRDRKNFDFFGPKIFERYEDPN